MTNKDILEKIREELKLPAEKYAGYAENMGKVWEFLDAKGIVFEENNKLAFVNHIITLFMRLEQGEKVDGIGEEILSQLDAEALDITRELLEMIGKIYGEADTAEIALVAIHINTAMALMSENDN